MFAMAGVSKEHRVRVLVAAASTDGIVIAVTSSEDLLPSVPSLLSIHSSSRPKTCYSHRLSRRGLLLLLLQLQPLKQRLHPLLQLS